jgi:hypothetical protein
MTGPVLVRSNMRTWDCTVFLTLGGIVLLAAGIVAVFGLLVLAGILAAVAFALALTGVLVRRHRVRLRRWVQDQGDGFLLIDQEGERSFTDERVLSMAFLLKQN